MITTVETTLATTARRPRRSCFLRGAKNDGVSSDCTVVGVVDH